MEINEISKAINIYKKIKTFENNTDKIMEIISNGIPMTIKNDRR